MSNVKKLDVVKHRRWRQIIGEAARSGVSIREFCRQRHLKEPQFYWWQRRLREGRAQHISGRCGAAGSGDVGPSSFALVSDASGEMLAGIELVLANGRRLRISRGVDEASLRTVLTALEAEPC